MPFTGDTRSDTKRYFRGLMTVAIVGALSAAAFGMFGKDGPIRTGDMVDEVAWEKIKTGGVPLFASSDESRVIIVEFGDVLCSFCRAAAPRIRGLRDRYGPKVAVFYRSFAGPAQWRGYMLSKGAVCAQGQYRAKEFLDIGLKASFDQGDIWQLLALADSAGIADRRRFSECVDSPTTIQHLAEDARIVRDQRMTLTPTYIVNRRVFVGIHSLDALEQFVAREVSDRSDR